LLLGDRNTLRAVTTKTQERGCGVIKQRAQQKARRKQYDLPTLRLEDVLSCSPPCLVMIAVHFMSAVIWTFLFLRGGCMDMVALRVPFHDPVVFS